MKLDQFSPSTPHSPPKKTKNKIVKLQMNQFPSYSPFNPQEKYLFELNVFFETFFFVVHTFVSIIIWKLAFLQAQKPRAQHQLLFNYRLTISHDDVICFLSLFLKIKAHYSCNANKYNFASFDFFIYFCCWDVVGNQTRNTLPHTYTHTNTHRHRDTQQRHLLPPRWLLSLNEAYKWPESAAAVALN